MRNSKSVIRRFFLASQRQGKFIGMIVKAAYLGGYNLITDRFEDGKIFAFFDPADKDADTITVLHK